VEQKEVAKTVWINLNKWNYTDNFIGTPVNNIIKSEINAIITQW